MSAVLSHDELLREMSTVELGICWALEFHENRARMLAANAATWKVEYPPIVKELHDAKTAAIVVRQQLEQVKQFSDKIVAAYESVTEPATHLFADAAAKRRAAESEHAKWVPHPAADALNRAKNRL